MSTGDFDPIEEQPGRRRNSSTTLVVVGAVVLAALAGAVVALSGAVMKKDSAAATRTTDTVAAEQTVAPTAGSSPTTSSGVGTTTPTATPTGRTPTATPTAGSVTPARTSFLTEPWNEGLDFGLLTGVRVRSDGTVVLIVDRAQFLTGDAAVAYGRTHKLELEDDYFLVNTNPMVREFTLAPNAVMFGNQELTSNPNSGDPSHPQRLTAQLLVQRVNARLAEQRAAHITGPLAIKLWLQHSGGTDGPVVFFQEQWVP